jgi:hypothetical protein
LSLKEIIYDFRECAEIRWREFSEGTEMNAPELVGPWPNPDVKAKDP